MNCANAMAPTVAAFSRFLVSGRSHTGVRRFAIDLALFVWKRVGGGRPSATRRCSRHVHSRVPCLLHLRSDEPLIVESRHGKKALRIRDSRCFSILEGSLPKDESSLKQSCLRPESPLSLALGSAIPLGSFTIFSRPLTQNSDGFNDSNESIPDRLAKRP